MKTAFRKLSSGGLALGALSAAALAETPAEIGQKLSAGRPAVAAILKRHPEYLTIWKEEPGWDDVLLRSPLLPGKRWRVHDLRRPQPPVVDPGVADCASRPPPADALALLGTTGTQAWVGPQLAAWSWQDGVLTSPAKTFGRIATKAAFGDVQVHLEFREPASHGSWQYRGNSGLFLMGRYEIQILDSFDNPTYPDGAMGALYGQVPPLAIASLPPGRWQCLDVVFIAPRFAGKRLVRPARATVWVNGIVVQANEAFLGPTKYAERPPYVAHTAQLPIELQDHGDGTSKVSFRNIWARPLQARP